MEIYFQDPGDIPVPREKVRIREFTAQPYPDGRRIRVYLEVTPFLNKPDAEITLENSLGEVVTSASVIESITPKMELTLHAPAHEGSGEHTLKAVVFYRIETAPEGDGDGERPGPYEILEVDRGEVRLTLPQPGQS
jgi:hypothetical protein